VLRVSQLPETFDFMGASAIDVTHAPAVHLLIPGGGRESNGVESSPIGIARVETAANFFWHQHLLGKSGLVVSSGYKSLGEAPAGRQYIEEIRCRTDGIPEAVMSDRLLGVLGVPKEVRRIEWQSIDTTTNFAFSRLLLPDDDVPLGIVSQEGHLERILRHIAPKTLDRDFFGVVVPELNECKPEQDRALAGIFSRAVLAGITPHTPNMDTKVARRAQVGWGVMKIIRAVTGKDSYNMG
jgi:hypothetical protein